MIARSLYRRFCFFRENAGYVTPPGLAACALELARAERDAVDAGIDFVYSPDDADAGWRLERDGRYRNVSVMVVRAVLGDDVERATTLAAIGGVEADADATYLRVVEANLALQALGELTVPHG